VLNEFVLGGGLFTSDSGIISQQLPGDPIQADLRQLENFSSKLFRTSTPKPGKVLELHFTINLTHHEYSMKRLSLQSLEQEYKTNILLWSLPILLKYIPLDQLLLVIGCALTEMRIIFRCPNLEVLSACVLGCLALLSPITWAGADIVILPPRMHDFIDAPSPIFFGVESMPQNFKMCNGLIIIDPLQQLVHMHPTDVVASHNFCLPFASKLHASLKPITDNILKLSRKVRNKRRNSQTNSPMIGKKFNETSDAMKSVPFDEQTDENDAMSENLEDTTGSSSASSSNLIRGPAATFLSSNRNSGIAGTGQRVMTSRLSSRTSNISIANRPISDGRMMPPQASQENSFLAFAPTPFDDFTNTSPILNTAILSFANVFKEHIQKIIHTSLQLQEERQQIILNLQNTPKEIGQLMRTYSDGSIETTSDSNVNANASASAEIFRTRGGQSEIVPQETFPRFNAGSGAANFLQKFQNTQSFSVYLEKITPPSPPLLPPVSFSAPSPALAPSAAERRNHSPVTSSLENNDDMSTLRDLQSSEDIQRQESQRLTADPLILLFNIMISGTCPLQALELSQLEERYLSLYPSDQSSFQFVTHTKQNTSRDLPQFFIAPSIDTWESVEMRSQLSPEAEDEPLLSLEFLERDLWCNGRCDGLANTEKCTNICLHVWEEKMLQLRKQTTALEIIKKNRTILRTQPSHHTDR
jgi:hypothetical protein